MKHYIYAQRNVGINAFAFTPKSRENKTNFGPNSIQQFGKRKISLKINIASGKIWRWRIRKKIWEKMEQFLG